MHRECGINNLTGNRIMTGSRLKHLGALATWRCSNLAGHAAHPVDGWKEVKMNRQVAKAPR
jgi:hypothetical protein